MKRARPTSWLIAAPPDKENYLLTIDSAKHVKSSTGVDVDFIVNVSDLGTGLNEIDLGQHLHWEIGAESVSIPNNVESFHSIDENNESIGFSRYLSPCQVEIRIHFGFRHTIYRIRAIR